MGAIKTEIAKQAYEAALEEVNKALKEKLDYVKYLYSTDLNEKSFQRVKKEEEFIKLSIALNLSSQAYIDTLNESIYQAGDKSLLDSTKMAYIEMLNEMQARTIEKLLKTEDENR